MAKPKQNDSFFNKLFRCTFIGESYLIFLLLVTFGVSFAAEGNWAAELFIHFQVQYILFLCLFGIITLFFAFNWRMAILAFGAAAYAGYLIMPQINYNKEEHAAISVYDKPLRIVQYNMRNRPDSFQPVLEWISETGLKDYDILVIQEAPSQIIKGADYMTSIYPYHIDKTSDGNFGTLVLSRHELKNLETIPLTQGFANYILRFDINKDGFKEDVRVYTLHTAPPITAELAKSRNQQLAAAAQIIQVDESPLKVLVGDLNITPYSPYFKKLLDKSGLQYLHQSKIVAPEGTWPSYTMLPFLQIPIDHILVSEGLIVDLERLPETYGSDHHPLVSSIIKKR